jgi:hypothetical protein
VGFRHGNDRQLSAFRVQDSRNLLDVSHDGRRAFAEVWQKLESCVRTGTSRQGCPRRRCITRAGSRTLVTVIDANGRKCSTQLSRSSETYLSRKRDISKSTSVKHSRAPQERQRGPDVALVRPHSVGSTPTVDCVITHPHIAVSIVGFDPVVLCESVVEFVGSAETWVPGNRAAIGDSLGRRD